MTDVTTTTSGQGDGELVWPLQVNILLYSAVSRVLQDLALTADITAVTTVLEMHSVFIEFHVLFLIIILFTIHYPIN